MDGGGRRGGVGKGEEGWGEGRAEGMRRRRRSHVRTDVAAVSKTSEIIGHRRSHQNVTLQTVSSTHLVGNRSREKVHNVQIKANLIHSHDVISFQIFSAISGFRTLGDCESGEKIEKFFCTF